MRHTPQIEYVQFSVMSAEDIKKLSVAEITLPASGGAERKYKTPFDPRLGPLENGIDCVTCGFDNKLCIGHPGHIELPIPISNIVFKNFALRVLQSVCCECGRLRILPEHAELKIPKTIKGLAALKHFSEKGKKIYICPWDDCGSALYNFISLKEDEFGRYYKEDRQNVIAFGAGEALNVFKKISWETVSMLGFNSHLSPNSIFQADGRHIHATHPKDFILTHLPVMSPIVTPYVVRDGQICDDDITEKYNTILKLRAKLTKTDTKKNPKLTKKDPVKQDIAAIERDLRLNVWSLMMRDSEAKQSATGRPYKSIEDRIGKKDGQIQVNIAGKRVDFSARDVIIGGGIELRNDEFGVPPCVASEITYPETVVAWNKDVLQRLVGKGVVNKVERRGPKGTVNVTRLSDFADKGRKFLLMIGDVIHRQMLDWEGFHDTFIANRQPSLRTESMKGFRLKIIPGKAFRLSEWATQSYNADFDGDEINLHFLQSVGANAECRILMRAAVHLVTAQRNGPVDGIVQDGLVGSLLLTNTWVGTQSNTMVSVDAAKAIIEEVGLTSVLKCMLKRARKYYPDYVSLDGDFCAKIIPGKLLMSILFPPYFRYKSKTDTNAMTPWVKIKDGIIKPDSGPLCKLVLGSKQLSVVHLLYKEYSPDIALAFLSNVQQLTNRWLPRHGFSVSLQDCTNKYYERIAEELAKAQVKVNAILARGGVEPTPEEEREIVCVLNSAMNINTKLGKEGMNKDDKNAFNIMRTSGAKGSVVNLTQITAMVGQQNIDGGRVPRALSGGTRCLPHFFKNDNSSDARGMVFSNYLTGLTPQESFFHAISGRKGIISTGVQTSETGYIQKRMCKKMEDFCVWIDGSVRDANGKIIQFLYGEDGMDAKKIYNVPPLKYPFFVNVKNLADKLNSKARLEGLVEEGCLKRTLTDHEKKFLLTYINASQPYLDNIIVNNQTKIMRDNILVLLKDVKVYEECIPELCAEIRAICECSKAQCGDMVGIISSCSMGEPTTQMILNVFHSAGLDAKVASMGVPRVNEILNATKSDKQKKASCIVHFTKKYRNMQSVDLLKYCKKNFEESYISTFYAGCELYYVPNDIPAHLRASPVMGNIYEEYKTPWWVKLHNSAKPKDPKYDAKDWILHIKLNVDLMFTKDVTLEEIADVVNNCSEGVYTAIPSPTALGLVEIRCNFAALPKREQLIGTREGLITEHNVNYFVLRDVCLEYIKKLKLCGIKGVAKVYLREECDTKVLDVCFARVTQIAAHKRFLDILTMKCVDPTKTTCDDMHTVNAVFGIEAARRFLIGEAERVISSEGTYVNRRHYALLVDSMMHTGEITSVRRDGIPRNAGPIAKIMFEDSVPNAIQSAVFGEVDMKTSVSSSVMLGILGGIGTGAANVVSSELLQTVPVAGNCIKKKDAIVLKTKKDRNVLVI